MQLFISPSKRDIKAVKTELEKRELFDKTTGVISHDGSMFVATTVTEGGRETSDGFVEITDPSINVSSECKYFVRERSPDQKHPSITDDMPKRYTIYGSMALFTAGSFAGWEETKIQRALTEWLKDKPGVTHVAVNSPISKQQNVIRHPGITRLVGDWGPYPADHPMLYDHPTSEDFHNAYWVTTTQNDIKQCWAPMYTMFSRGNIKEKARVLNSPIFKSSSNSLVVDLYCGIGYFFLSYAQLKPRLILGWDINAWSIEGLRRGAQLAKLSLQVVKEGEKPDWSKVGPPGTTHAIVFNESNEKAVERIEELRRFNETTTMEALPLTHINMGLLPDCKQAWGTATSLAQSGVTTYHVHENVAMNEIEEFTRERGKVFGKHLHTEMVKTFAPGVGHIVWDFIST
ncbi:S-adenosyl-L-methionine-dependent methyltransferase [Yarrowia lipolytica]|jgi:tRNA wybutosine-synthesizing protein 2|uniref:tRNA wybutosine-synthesizing protein 2 n=1 Tax=Yarrowia lipolytica TaxID=4952 RepID=A0A371C7J9_YARLL|nr:S-adenosyl-L-methionine-dependent methyltransferase [Yarrowia lipolytica]RDW32272.1 S-adenosyl-L-methionine-dependent methyltransferase [Yarrowia lipolytica]RDW38314.1 S-adenosyl-L-methionine-dependent methyltransferase [Yarrowia lipolytica]RDW46091.1 S-adenosyl-L-methionine-dependent methyltransferase [Yarrowia lipolytica]RDW54092.1 S-adenosyl-L-methionine-dependent methyltransferase [Yarrowia lipolytica]